MGSMRDDLTPPKVKVRILTPSSLAKDIADFFRGRSIISIINSYKSSSDSCGVVVTRVSDKRSKT